MSRHLTVSEQILKVMRRTPDCRLDDLVLSCKSFSLQALLCEVSRLSRVGQLQLTLVSTGSFTLQLLIMNCRPRLERGLLTRRGNHGKGERRISEGAQQSEIRLSAQMGQRARASTELYLSDMH
jgi:hypothetical protein